MNSSRICAFSLFVVSLSMVLSSACASAQFCAGVFRVPTITEYADNTEFLAVVTWVHAIPGTETDTGATEFEVVTVIRQPDHEKDESVLEDKFLQSVNAVQVGVRIGFGLHLPGKPGNLYLIAGTMHRGKLNWGIPRMVTKAALQYCLEAPSSRAPASERIRYRAGFIDTNDPQIADDAFHVLEYASYENLQELRGDFSRLKLRKLLANPQITTDRQSVCFRLLGIYGSENDAQLLEPFLFAKEDEAPDQREVLIAYLLLKGERGLAVLEDKLKDAEAEFKDQDVALSAIRYVAHNTTRIPRDRMIQSLRIALDHKDLAESAIFELAHLKDWEIQDQLFGMLLSDKGVSRGVRLAVTRYFLAAASDVDDSRDPQQLPRRTLQAKQFLNAIERERPDLLEEANKLAQVDALLP